MTTITLERFCYSDTETEGLLWLDEDTYVHTLERPWRAGAAGGMPFESCVPDGAYRLLPHVRPNGDRVLALRNPDLGVYYTAEERGEQPGRYLILIHSGNTVDDVVGCVAPGEVRTIHQNRRFVASSRRAMARVMATEATRLIIRCACGTDG